MTAVGVLGAGAWGTALASHLALQGHEVVIYAREPELAEAIARDHRNERYLAGHQLAATLRATTDLGEAAGAGDVVVNAVPSHATRSVLGRAAAAVRPDALVVNASKGMEVESLTFLSTVVEQALPGRPYVVLSGPSFAAEVAAGQPTAVVAAARDPDAARRVQALFSTGRFRVYTSSDVTGVEVAGALKNVIAIAAGALDGLGFGHNPRAALLTRGLAEIMRLGEALGADPRTFAGLAGIGDLVLTCTGGLSRNRALGVALGRGATLAEYTATHHEATEGVNAARAALRLAERVGVELPITGQVAAVLFDAKPVTRAVADLMERALKSEQLT